MKERPILFSAPMVLALLAGKKTQTRRFARFEPYRDGINLQASSLVPGHYCTGMEKSGWVLRSMQGSCWNDRTKPLHCPHGSPGDRLWVQESYHVLGHGAGGPSLTVKYLADGVIRTLDVSSESYLKFRARKTDGALGGRFMYRDISRLLLGLTAVRVERLTSITESDAIAEGIEQVQVEDKFAWKNYRFLTAHPRRGSRITDEEHRIVGYNDPRHSYRSLWESLNGVGSWEANPWVFVESLRRIEQ